MADNVSIARRLYDGWNERAFDEIVQYAADDAELTIVGTGDVFRGKDGVRKYNENWATGFPDGRVAVDRVHGDGDTVVVEFTGQGTHTGTLATSMGDIPATGRSMTLKLCDVIEFRDGLIARQRSYFDTGSMMAQLGLLPEKLTTSQKK
ncbi:ester cyclase [Nocardioides iriomotensis]|jgi:steroid delta-isomerase-like uncharacterized protein|nr:ester cyclase [Nocardioides iriomotensis]